MDLTLPLHETQDNTQFWPIMGMKEPVKKFWNKPLKSFAAGQASFESVFSRVGKKKQKPKQYYYFLTEDKMLCYSRKKGEKVKGWLQIDDSILIKLSTFTIGQAKSLGIQFYRSDQATLLVFSTENSNALFELWETLTPICAMNNFDDMYLPMSPLGKGSFATVYKVKRVMDDQIFAAKVYYRDTLNSSQHKDKFVSMIKNEINVLRKIGPQEGIAGFYEVYQQADKIVLITEFVAGPDLYQLLKRKKVIKERKACFLIQQIAAALEKIHGSGYVHRDLKLENVLLQSYETYESKLVDFGFAEEINENMLTSKAGTPGYIPPELYANLPYTPKGDIFSLGVLLFSLVGGYSPFKGRTYKQIMDSNRQGKIVFEKPIWQYVSLACQEMIMKMCHIDPTQRPSASEIISSQWAVTHSLPQGQRLEMSNILVLQNMPQQAQQDDQDRGILVPSFYQKSAATLKSLALSQRAIMEEIDPDFEATEGTLHIDVAQLQRGAGIFKNKRN